MAVAVMRGRTRFLVSVLVALLAHFTQHTAQGAVALNCKSVGVKYAANFTSITPTTIANSAALNTALAAQSTGTPAPVILSLAAGMYNLTTNYTVLNNVCIQGAGMDVTTLVAAYDNRHFIKSDGMILQLVGMKVWSGMPDDADFFSAKGTFGGVAFNASLGSFNGVTFYRNSVNADDNKVGDFIVVLGGALKIASGSTVTCGDGIVFLENFAGGAGGAAYVDTTSSLTIGK